MGNCLGRPDPDTVAQNKSSGIALNPSARLRYSVAHVAHNETEPFFAV